MKIPKRITALVLLASLGASAMAMPASAATFSDVPSDHWAYDVIDEISDEKLMVGVDDGLFASDKTLSRAEFATILFNCAPSSAASKGDALTKESAYPDVADDAWYKAPIIWAAEHDYLQDDEGNLLPDEAVSREEMAVAIYEFLNDYKNDVLIYDSVREAFNDDGEFTIPGALDKAYILANNGVLGGKGNNIFDPQGSLTRAEMASVTSRMMVIMNTENDVNNVFKERAQEVLEAGEVELSEDEQEFIDLLNKEREKEGLAPLKPSKILMEGAAIRAHEVTDKASSLSRDDFFDKEKYPADWWHERPDGRSATTVIQDLMDDQSVVVWENMRRGENLALRYGDSYMEPQKAFVGLMGSDGHRENMMESTYQYIGVAYNNDGHSSTWSQLFAGVVE